MKLSNLAKVPVFLLALSAIAGAETLIAPRPNSNFPKSTDFACDLIKKLNAGLADMNVLSAAYDSINPYEAFDNGTPNALVKALNATKDASPDGAKAVALEDQASIFNGSQQKAWEEHKRKVAKAIEERVAKGVGAVAFLSMVGHTAAQVTAQKLALKGFVAASKAASDAALHMSEKELSATLQGPKILRVGAFGWLFLAAEITWATPTGKDDTLTGYWEKEPDALLIDQKYGFGVDPSGAKLCELLRTHSNEPFAEKVRARLYQLSDRVERQADELHGILQDKLAYKSFLDDFAEKAHIGQKKIFNASSFATIVDSLNKWVTVAPQRWQKIKSQPLKLGLPAF